MKENGNHPYQYKKDGTDGCPTWYEAVPPT